MAYPLLGELAGVEKVDGSCRDRDLPTLVRLRALMGSQHRGVVGSPRKQVSGPTVLRV